ncbi:hypothetical protein ES703_101013 [subsurface metagenome]
MVAFFLIKIQLFLADSSAPVGWVFAYNFLGLGAGIIDGIVVGEVCFLVSADREPGPNDSVTFSSPVVFGELSAFQHLRPYSPVKMPKGRRHK